MGFPLIQERLDIWRALGLLKKKKTTGTSEVKITVFLHYKSYWGARSGMLVFGSEMSIIGSCFII